VHDNRPLCKRDRKEVLGAEGWILCPAGQVAAARGGAYDTHVHNFNTEEREERLAQSMVVISVNDRGCEGRSSAH
jgi:hypothetical protein